MTIVVSTILNLFGHVGFWKRGQKAYVDSYWSGFRSASGRGVDDAKLFLLNTLYRRLGNSVAFPRLLFVSSAFNTLRPVILGEKTY